MNNFEIIYFKHDYICISSKVSYMIISKGTNVMNYKIIVLSTAIIIGVLPTDY